MSVNSSSNSSFHAQTDYCANSSMAHFIVTALLISQIVLLPLFILVLYVGYQRWRKQRSFATPVKTSHSDIFTYNMVVQELMGILGSCIRFHGLYTNQETVLYASIYIYSIVSTGQTLLHNLTCVERYLAVVHPITYRGLKQSGGIRIRNTSISCVWVFCIGTLGLSRIDVYSYMIYQFLFLVVSSVGVSFCSLSVLYVLIRPGPGESGRKRERTDKTKQRALHTITIIMAALLMRFVSSLVSLSTYHSPRLSQIEKCVLGATTLWCDLPSSLVLPLLFLHRVGKRPGCKHKTESC